MLNFLIWIIVGAIIGWVASIVMGTNKRQGLLGDIVVGIVGAFVAGLLISPLVGAGTINEGDFSIPALLVSLLGAVVLLVIFRLLRGLGSLVVLVFLGLAIYLYCSIKGMGKCRWLGLHRD